MTTHGALTRSTLKLIRVTLLAGVLGFGVVVWYILQTAAPEPLDERAANALRIAFLAVVLLDLPLLFVLRSAQSRVRGYASAARLTIVGWAQGEGVALFGTVLYLLTARVSLWVLGVLVLLTAFVLVPLPGEESEIPSSPGPAPLPRSGQPE
jgi:uncharacterized membrane protein